MTTPADPNFDKVAAGKPLEPVGPTQPKTPEGFESYMQKQTPTTTPPSAGQSPVDALRPQNLTAANPTFETIQAQTKQVQDGLGEVHKKLNDKNLKLSRSQSHLVRQKLTDANQYMHSAGSKLGAKMPEEETSSGLSGIARFLAMVNDGQDQLVAVQQQLKELSKKKEGVNPADMMSIQIKMGLAQQEIEYTSTLLSKVVQSITQLLNTQL